MPSFPTQKMHTWLFNFKDIFFILIGFILYVPINSLAQTDSLSRFRPRYSPRTIPASNTKAVQTETKPIVPSNHINNSFQVIMDSIAENNRKIEYAEGFRISVYTGNNRQLAIKSKELFQKKYPEIPVYFTYKLPTFKLKVGDYFNKLDAQLAAQKLLADFPDALIVQDQINVR